MTPGECFVPDTALRYGATAYDAVYISFCLSRDIPLITAKKTTAPWVAKLKNLIESVR